ncbi:Rim8p [Sugiyamaella lignohabitans]|uniref:pH-response regulator protein palF/RIM8 n=1 Tax=Sugiyamaella lignohabitans TaxID=796027 RepID=A0A167D9B9_9ASCO|nr:Rim8p [Sugiyamaella lignohabitans]ANB12640.1 Rim8p [Sugiyamaella lignohabitans]
MFRTLSKLRPIFHSTIQRNSNSDDFFVELNDPHKTFSPGSVVDGSVVLVLAKPEKVSHIECTIQGTVTIRNALVKSKTVKNVLFQQKVELWGHAESTNGSDLEVDFNGSGNSPSPGSSGQLADSSCNVSVHSGKSAKSCKSTKSSKSSKSVKSIKSTHSDRSVASSSAPTTGVATAGPSGSTTAATATTSAGSSNTSINATTGVVTPSAKINRITDGTQSIALRDRAPDSSTRSASSSQRNSEDLHYTTAKPGSGPATNSILSDDSASSNQTSTTYPGPTKTDQPLPRGEHLFAFEFVLPEKGLFNSLEFERGSISYTITATCHRTSPPTVITAQKAVSVICPIDIATLPVPRVSTLTVDVQKKRKGHGSIVVAVSLPRKGYLRGDSIPVKVNVQHIKHVKCLSGIITTLSRISIVSAQGTEAQSFRKDLSQTVSPLYTDPVSFKSTVITNIRIPPDTFPTTKGRDDISFQYCIEVVLDLSGKRAVDLTSSGRDNDFEPSKLGFIDTDKLKRGRGVVSLWSEVVIGTHNGGSVDLDGTASSPGLKMKLKGKAPASNTSLPSTMYSSNTVVGGPGPGNGHTSAISTVSAASTTSNGQQVSFSSSSTTVYNVLSYEELAAADQASAMSSSNMSAENEKELLRRREQAILPSNPPESSLSYTTNHEVPSYYEESAPSSSVHLDSSAPPPHLVMASAPTYSDEGASSSASGSSGTHMAGSSHTSNTSTELLDKAEMERARLEQIASVPEEEYVPRYEPIQNHSHSHNSSHGIDLEPSAPALPADLSHDHVHNPDQLDSVPSAPPPISGPSSPPPLPPSSDPSQLHDDEPSAPALPAAPPPPPPNND